MGNGAIKQRWSTGRLEALSDGVFAVALTLLTFDVVAAAKNIAAGERLASHLAMEWPTFLAYIVGFLTILVCWINHHCVFRHVQEVDSGLVWVNGLQLALVALVPLPTAALAAHIADDDQRTALMLYGATFWLIATSFWVLTQYVQRRGLVNDSGLHVQFAALRINYGYSVAWTIACLFVASINVYPALLMWAIMFVVFAFPEEFARGMASRRH